MLLVLAILVLLLVGVSRHAGQRYQRAMAMGSKLQAPLNFTAGEIATEFLWAHGISDVEIVPHEALVTDYFDPGRRRLFLRPAVADGRNLAAWAVALHEAAHALQAKDEIKGDAEALRWRQSCIRLTRYLPTFTALGAFAIMVLRRLPAMYALGLVVVAAAIAMLLNAGTVAIEYNANKRLRLWLDERLSSHQAALEDLEPLLAAVATRELGDLLRSPTYFFFSALPGSGKIRPE